MTVTPELKLIVRIVFCIVVGLVLAVGVVIRPRQVRGADGADAGVAGDNGARRGKDAGEAVAAPGSRNKWWVFAVWFVIGAAAALVMLTSDRLYS